MLSDETTARAESGARLRIKRAVFLAVKTIMDFDFSAHPSIDWDEDLCALLMLLGEGRLESAL